MIHVIGDNSSWYFVLMKKNEPYSYNAPPAAEGAISATLVYLYVLKLVSIL